MNARLIPLAALALCLCSCGQKPDMYRDALETEIIRLVGADAKVTFNKVERIDSTTFGQEVDKRIQAFTTKLEQDTKLYEKYMADRMLTNAEKKKQAMVLDEKMLAGLEKLRARIEEADSLDVVAYYDYHFSGYAKCGSEETTFPDNYASITPNGKVLSLNDSRKGLHNALGKVIPGYKETLDEASGK